MKRCFMQVGGSLPLAAKSSLRCGLFRYPLSGAPRNAQALFKNKTFSIKIKLWKKISLKMNPSKMNSLL